MYNIVEDKEKIKETDRPNDFIPAKGTKLARGVVKILFSRKFTQKIYI